MQGKLHASDRLEEPPLSVAVMHQHCHLFEPFLSRGPCSIIDCGIFFIQLIGRGIINVLRLVTKPKEIPLEVIDDKYTGIGGRWLDR